MSSINEVKILRRRAKAFYNRALDSLNAKDYDLASFLSEQAVQLYLKSILLKELGDYPRTHSISHIISILKKLSNYKDLINFLEENRLAVRLMEDSYISSRYLIREFSREEAKILINIAKEVLKRGEV
ncbi:HEPN domain-containing protein [Candidatus Bathyarchaeota archaeon]|nr:HEPN domain-containing protein [Candidatus Bathyarchaeota archaeon]